MGMIGSPALAGEANASDAPIAARHAGSRFMERFPALLGEAYPVARPSCEDEPP
jgi:hypothetical protein